MAKRKKLYYWIGFLGLPLLLIVGTRLMGLWGGKQLPKVEVGKVERRDIKEQVSASGNLEPVKEVKLSPEVSGEIIKITVKEGDTVKKGQLLVEIRPDNYEAQLEQAVANLNSTRANHAQAKARVAQAQARLVLAKQNWERNQSLYQDSALSQAEYQQSQSDYESAKLEVQAAKEQVSAAFYSMQSARANVDNARQNLQLTTIYAPADGIVSKLDVELGERVLGTSQMQGTEMLRIADLNIMEAIVEVSENDVVKITLGDTASLIADSYPDDTLLGYVTDIAHTAKETASEDAVTEFEVKIRLLPASYRHLEKPGRAFPLRSGMTVTADITTEIAQNVLAVPMQSVAVRGEGDKQEEQVFELKGELIHSRKVGLGINDYQYIELKQGPEAGTEIVVGPYNLVSETLQDSMAVERSQQGK